MGCWLSQLCLTHEDATTHSLLDEEIMVVVCHRLLLYAFVLEEGITRQVRSGLAVC